MGLDMYLLAKVKGDNEEHVKKCCGGMFPFGLKTDKQEIGYWRKAYDVCDAIMSKLKETRNIEDDNCVDFLLTDEEIEYFIRYAKEEVEIHADVLKAAQPSEEYWAAMDWKNALKFFRNAKKLRKADKTVEIYYSMWY